MAAVRQGHPFWGNRKLSRPWRPPRSCEHHQRKPQYTHNTLGDMAMTGSLNQYHGAGPVEATEPPPLFQGGSAAASQVLASSAYRTGRGATQGCTPGLYQGPAPMGSNSTRGRQCSHTGSTGKPGKNGNVQERVQTCFPYKLVFCLQRHILLSHVGLHKFATGALFAPPNISPVHFPCRYFVCCSLLCEGLHCSKFEQSRVLLPSSGGNNVCF